MVVEEFGFEHGQGNLFKRQDKGVTLEGLQECEILLDEGVAIGLDELFLLVTGWVVQGEFYCSDSATHVY